MNRDLLMLAKVYEPQRHRIAGSFMSEKIDGIRAVWVPEARGKPVAEIPFLNTDKKSHRKNKNPKVSGLFSRYGNLIFAPDSFLDQLPKDTILDGELNFGRGNWSRTSSCVKDFEPGPDWANIKYSVFDSPMPDQLFKDGRINNPNYKKTISWVAAQLAFGYRDVKIDKMSRIYEFTLNRLKTVINGQANVEIAPQIQLPFNTIEAEAKLKAFYDEIVSNGGEGVILRLCSSEWEPIRSNYLHKMKAELDSEGKVVGFKVGKGKHEGRLGSIKLEWGNTTFDLSGFTDEERAFNAAMKSGTITDFDKEGNTTKDIAEYFKIGDIVTFKYRETGADGRPKEGKFWRVAV